MKTLRQAFRRVWARFHVKTVVNRVPIRSLKYEHREHQTGLNTPEELECFKTDALDNKAKHYEAKGTR